MIKLPLNGDIETLVLNVTEVQGGGGGGGTDNYNELYNKPSINGVTLKGDVELEELGIVEEIHMQVEAATSTLAEVAKTGSYNDLSDKPDIPDLSEVVKRKDLANVAISGDYSDLYNRPEIPDVSDFVRYHELSDAAYSGSYNDLKDKPDMTPYAKTADLAAVAQSGSYTDLSSTPDLTQYAKNNDIATVGKSGRYDDLSNKPDLSQYAKDADFARVAKSGSFNDLLDAPDMSQYAKDNALAAVAKSGSYDDLSGKPSLDGFINSVEAETIAGNAVSANNVKLQNTATLVVSSSSWATDGGYKSVTLSLSEIYDSVPTVMLGAPAGTLPTDEQRKSYGKVQYATVDTATNTLKLYASEAPTSSFYVIVKGAR